MAVPHPLVVALALAFSSAQAQETELPAVNVTAKGHVSSDLDTPSAVIALDREQLLNGGAAGVGDALRGRSGLAVNSDGAWGQNPVIRGLKRESTVLLMDGARVNAAQPYGALSSMADINLLDRIEVVKGPTSVLYGTGALGGVINLIGPQAGFGTGTAFETTAGMDTASKGTHAAGRLNIGGSDHALVLAAGVRHAGDYESPDGRVAQTGYDSESALGQYRFRLTDRTMLKAGLQRHTDKNVWYPGSAQRPASPPGLGLVTIHSPRQERTLIDAGIDHQGSGESPLDLSGRVYRQEVYREIRAHSDQLGRDRVRTRVTFATDGTQARADWSINQDQLLSVGVDGWTQTADPERYVDNNPPFYDNNTRLDPFDQGKLTSRGLFIQDELTIDRLRLLAGVRHDVVRGTAASRLVAVPPGAFVAASADLERSDTATSWSVGGVWQAARLFSPYASVARAFRAPDLRERYESSERGDGYFYFGNPQVRPENALNTEIGVKGESADASYSLAFYRNRITDYLAGRVTGQVFSGVPVKATENIGKVTIQGLEAEGRYRITGSHFLLGGLSALRGNNRVDNEPLSRMPADELSLGWEGGIARGWTADTRLRLVRRQDRVATVFARGTENASPGFATLDLGATWKTTSQTLRVALRNLANKAYHEHLTEGVSGQEIQAPGRSLQVTWNGVF